VGDASADYPYRPDVAKFGVAFTRAIIAWNEIEESARAMLSSLSQGGIGVTIAVLHMGNIALQDALRAVVDSSREGVFASMGPALPSQSCDHILHFVDGMNVLRIYRNFFVHSIKGMGRSPHDPATFHANLYHREAKGRLATVYETVTTREIQDYVRSAIECGQYGRVIVRHFEKPGALTAFTYSEPPEPLETLSKPAWPKPPPVLVRRPYFLTRNLWRQTGPQYVGRLPHSKHLSRGMSSAIWRELFLRRLGPPSSRQAQSLLPCRTGIRRVA